VVAPAILVIFHFYVFLQLYGLAAKAREYNDLIKEQVQVDSDRQRVRQRLDTFLVLQFLAGPKEQRTRFQGFSLRLIAWITLVGAPILILLQAQVVFLPYHDPLITWAQRLLLVGDLFVISCAETRGLHAFFVNGSEMRKRPGFFVSFKDEIAYSRYAMSFLQEKQHRIVGI
jgi:hypothetical protein